MNRKKLGLCCLIPSVFWRFFDEDVPGTTYEAMIESRSDVEAPNSEVLNPPTKAAVQGMVGNVGYHS